MTVGENLLVMGTSFTSALLVAVYLASLGMGLVQVVVGAVIAFDVIGGAVCNMTDTTKRWYHRSGRTAKDHLTFIGLHLLHIALVAWMFRGPEFDWRFMIFIGGWLLVSALTVLSIPDLLKRPAAVTLYLIAFAAALYAVGPTPGLEWFVPILFTKLLLGHAVPPEKG
ncbi:hypothetical protein [Algihabitans albus]|uniref:hypothetical protein n=1 Tax=Algihabitans albus TaxID=2164067 RepID=UPI0013C2F404|nr:hypothetical protein [Algihabitans albus]